MKLRASWERRASYATICEWIVDAWAKVSALTDVRAFAKASKREPGMFDGEIAQLFDSDTEDEDFDGFVTEE